jgi:hypothetical protein
MAEKNRSTITFGTEDLRAAVSNYNSLSLPEIQAAYSAMLEVPEFGLKVAQALQTAAKTAANGKGSPDRVLDAAVVPAFLVGLLVGASSRNRSRYAVFTDTGERRFPKRGEWYFCVKALGAYPNYYGIEFALAFGAEDYGILKLES